MEDDAAGNCTDESTEVTAWLRLVPAQDRPNPSMPWGMGGCVVNCYLLGYEGSDFFNSVPPSEWPHSNIRSQTQIYGQHRLGLVEKKRFRLF